MSRHVKDKISLYIDGKLEGAALRAFEAHMKTCGECGSVLAETKQAVKAAKGAVKDADLPVNFYVKLNKKLDTVDAAGKAPAFNWGNFTRGAAAVCTMLIVGVFVYTIGKQTGNFSNLRMKQNEQMPKTAEAPVETKKEDTAAGGKAAVKFQAAPMKKKAVEQENAYVTDKITLGVAEKKDADLEYKGYVQKEAALDAKMESLGLLEKPSTTASRSVKSTAPAPAAKMKVAAASDMAAGAGMEMDEAVVSEPVAEEAESQTEEKAQPLEESVFRSMEAGIKADAIMAQPLAIVRSESGKCGQELAVTKGAISKGYLQAIVSGRTITVQHKDAPAACGNPVAVYSGSIGGNSILVKEKMNYVNGMQKCMCEYNFSVAFAVPAPGTYNITVVTDDNGSLSTLAIDVIVE